MNCIHKSKILKTTCNPITTEIEKSALNQGNKNTPDFVRK